MKLGYPYLCGVVISRLVKSEISGGDNLELLKVLHEKFQFWGGGNLELFGDSKSENRIETSHGESQ